VDATAATVFISGYAESRDSLDRKHRLAPAIYGFLVHEPATAMASNDTAANQL
jgi:hypothetical protein